MKFRSLGFTSSRSIPSQLRFPASVTAEECRTEIGIYFILHPLLNLCTWSASGSRRKKTSNRSTRYSSVEAGLAVRVQIFPTMRKGDTFTITCTYTLCNFTLTAANSPLDEPRVCVSTKVASLNAVLDWKGMPAWGPTQIAIRITVIDGWCAVRPCRSGKQSSKEDPWMLPSFTYTPLISGRFWTKDWIVLQSPTSTLETGDCRSTVAWAPSCVDGLY
jgi:hypothetical protein